MIAKVVEDYIEAKKQTEALAAEARQQMQVHFGELLKEASMVAQQFTEHFGVPPVCPAGVTFNGQTAPEAPGALEEANEQTAIGPKIGGLRRSLTAAIKRGDAEAIAKAKERLKALGVVELKAEAAAAAVPEQPDEPVEPMF